MYTWRVSDLNLTLIIEPGSPDWSFRLIVKEPQSGLRVVTHRGPVPTDRLKAEAQGAFREIRRCVTKGATLDRLEGHARLLFESLFPRPVKEFLSKMSGQLSVFAPALSLPWALLHDGDDFLLARWAVGELRASDGDEVHVRRSPVDVGRFLIVADPAEDLPAARFEGESIVRAASSLVDSGGCDLRLGRHRRSDLMRAFHRYDFIHFAGHADPGHDDESGWRLADGHLSPNDIASLSGRHAPRFVFANACRSSQEGIVAALMTAGVRHFVGTRVDLPDLLGADLATRFYESLIGGMSVGQALRRAALAAREKNEPVWLAYHLLGDPSVCYFEDSRVEQLPAGKRNGAVLCIRWPFNRSELEGHAKEIEHWRRDFFGVITKHGGRVLPSGELVQRAVFGLPVSFENDLFRAASAALELVHLNPDANCTVNFGALVMKRTDIIGPVLHHTESLTANGPAGVYIASSASVLLADSGEFESTDRADLMMVKGLKTPTVGSATALIGREEEVASLGDLAREAMRGQTARGAVLVGTAGMGKSHIMHTVAGSISSDYRVVWGRSVAYAESSPYAPFIQILSELSGVTRTNRETEARALLSAYLKGLDGHQGSQSGTFTVIPIEDLLHELVEEESLTDYLDPLLALLGFET
ncbi:MAG: CHAT domain-containing protein, partial [Myxococcota bacterium]|nr:CHAT domain-containing protein [Myxococcota bacterium]